MYNVEVQNADAYPVDEAGLQRAARTVLTQHEQAAGSSIAIKLAGDEIIRQLNQTFRSIDAPTDVLSFPTELPPLPADAGEMPEEWLHLGDLAIAYPYVQAQALRLSQPIEHNLLLMVVHGTLHLLGYDHNTPERRAEMWQAQEVALQALAVPLEIVPALEEFDE